MSNNRDNTQLIAFGHYGKGETEIPPYIDLNIGRGSTITFETIHYEPFRIKKYDNRIVQCVKQSATQSTENTPRHKQ